MTRAPLHFGDRVYDKADRRHVGIIRSIISGTANIRWEETGWLSCRVPLADLRRARGRVRSPLFNLRRAVAGRNR